MKTTIYDKAIWHIDNGIPSNQVIKHFDFMINWCDTHHLLTEEGKEILHFGIDESISLHSKMFTDRGNLFMEKFYDKYISVVDPIQEMNVDLNTL